MNAQFEIRRARSASAALSVAIALAFGLNAPAQAQYSYPGTAASSGHYAHSIHPIRAGGVERGGRQPSVSGAGFGQSNPSMRRGEACPPGNSCATPVPARGGDGSGSGHPTGGYGAHESYGYAASPMQTHRNAAVGGKAISPVRAGGRAALNYGPSQTSNTNFRNSVTGKSSGPSVNTAGQQTSFTGPNGKKVSMGGSQTFTGPNGKKQTIGGGPDLNNLGGGYGHQKGSGIKQGMSYSADGNGSISGTRTGSAPGMASAGGMNMNNGGTSGVSEQAGAPDSVREWGHRQLADSDPNVVSTTSSDKGTVTWHGDQKWSGTDAQGLSWNRGKPWNGPDGKGGTYQDGHDVKMVQNKDEADMGPTAGPGEIVSGTGQVVHPGQKKGQDTGGGQTDDAGTTHSGGRNAQGQYIAPSGQDAPVKPKEQGTLKMDYNGKNGAIDPKVNGTNGGGG